MVGVVSNYQLAPKTNSFIVLGREKWGPEPAEGVWPLFGTCSEDKAIWAGMGARKRRIAAKTRPQSPPGEVRDDEDVSSPSLSTPLSSRSRTPGSAHRCEHVRVSVGEGGRALPSFGTTPLPWVVPMIPAH